MKIEARNGTYRACFFSELKLASQDRQNLTCEMKIEARNGTYRAYFFSELKLASQDRKKNLTCKMKLAMLNGQVPNTTLGMMFEARNGHTGLARLAR